MATYKKVTPAIIDELRSIAGEKNILTEEDKLIPYSQDEVTDPRYHHMPEVVVLAENTEQVSAVLKLANRELIPVVPRGAGTGLACGAVPLFGGIVLSVEKMNKILHIDAENLYMTVEAGVRTELVQKTAREAGLFYAGDPCSGDSCFIGGNVATNAGGNKAIKYGTTRNQVYEVEIVTPQGGITTVGGRLNKSSTGYCLEQLMIGSEGTLGIITKVTLKLLPLPKESMDLLAVFNDTDSAIRSIGKLTKAGVTPTCVEFMDNVAIRCSEAYTKDKLPYDETGNYLIILLEADSEEALENMAVTVDEVCRENGAVDVLVPDSQKIWHARKSFAEAVRNECLIHSNEDIVVPIDKMPEAMRKMSEICARHEAVARTVSHAGDGNIHISIMLGSIPEEEWPKKLSQIHHDIFDYVYPIGGRLSGEHGIGYKKKALMEEYTDPVQLEMMRSIKRALDPNLILNPGKIFDVE